MLRLAVASMGTFTMALGVATTQYPPNLLAGAGMVGSVTVAAGVLALAAAVVWRRPLLSVAAACMVGGTAMRLLALSVAWEQSPSWVGAGAAAGMGLATVALLTAWTAILVHPSTHPRGGRHGAR